MSAQYSYLKLSLRYVHGAKSTTVFSFPSSEKAQRPSFDAPEILSRFVNINEFYVMGCHSSQRYFSFVSVDDSNGSGGARLELTLMVEEDVLLPGRSILNLFNSVKDMLEHDEPLNDTTLSAALSASGFPEEPMRCHIEEEPNRLTDCPCYRTYVSSNDLAVILSFPRQAAYKHYSETVMVHVTAVPSAEAPLPQITVPVSQAFAVVCPPDVTASADSVVLTDRLSLTYTRPGFEPATISFEVGTTNRYVKISGPALIVNDAAKAAIVFVQKVDYTVVSSKGTPVTTYTILINGRTATRADGRFEVTSNDFNKEGTVNISVSSTNFFTTSIDFTSEELAAQNPLELILVPEELPVVLRLDFGEGRMMQQELLFEKSSAEYRQLRAGSFHGFRAHRLMSHEPETYNIDMTGGAAKAAAPAPAVKPVQEAPKAADVKPAETVVAVEPETKPESEKPAEPERPKSAAELRAERLRNDIPQKPAEEEAEKEKSSKLPFGNRKKAYANDIPRKVDILEDDPDDEEEHRNSVFKSIFSPVVLAAVAVALIIGGIVWYIYTLLPSNNTDMEQVEMVDITNGVDAGDADRITVIDDVNSGEVKSEQPAEPAAEAAPADAANEKADVEYLNSHEKWALADLKSQKYRDFFNSLGEGDIAAIANADYFAVKGQATNKKAVKVVDYLWEAKGTFAEKRNVNALRDLKGKDTIDIHELYELLARMRDANPNKSERPQREQ